MRSPLRAPPDTRHCALHRGDGERPHRDRPLTRAILRRHGLAVTKRAEGCGGGAGGRRRRVGAFAVIPPLIVRDVYGGGSRELALVNTRFSGGMIASTMLQIRLGALRRPRRAVLLALAGGAVVLAAMSAPGPLWGFALTCFVWGVGAGVVLSQGRTIASSRRRRATARAGHLPARFRRRLARGRARDGLPGGAQRAAAGAAVYPAAPGAAAPISPREGSGRSPDP
ncbi:MAG: hypothetical protein Q7W02_29070 [Candidatus Rokubacteria bacterium]|nr:hypothetical protein [Candidatus Rokubacteria bacterium]